MPDSRSRSTRPATIVDVLRDRAAREGERPAYTFLASGERAVRTVTFADLDRRACAIAAALRAQAAVGDRALLLYPSGLEFIEAFWGCLYAGVIAVPAYPPRTGGHGAGRLDAIAQDCTPSLVLTTRGQLETASDDWARLAARAPVIATDEIAETGDGDIAAGGDGIGGRLQRPSGEAIAMLQYSSGSTAAPKGVIVSHRGIVANQEMIRDAFRHDAASTFVGWLPFFHDMGLFGNIIQPLFVGAHSVLMSPMAFLQKPVRWLRAISEHRAHTSGAPNFGYEYCVRRISDEEKAGLDLRSWRRAFNGAEKPRPETIARFTEAFAPYGFAEEMFYPCYGLAEAVLFVSGRDTQAHPAIAQAVPASDPAGLPHVSSGQSWGEQRVEVVDPQTRRRCPDGTTGEIWISGPHIADGYWQQPAATEAVFRARLADDPAAAAPAPPAAAAAESDIRIGARHEGHDDGDAGPFLRTGDLGCRRDGELFIVGRLKDLIILRGQNYHPEDIEAIVEASDPELEPGQSVAFGLDDAQGADGPVERLIVLIEAGRRPLPEPALRAACDRAAAAVTTTFGVAIGELLLVKRGSIPKTSSGKVQRFLSRARFVAGDLEPLLRIRYDGGERDEPGAPVDTGAAGADAGPARRAAIERALWARLRGLMPAATEAATEAAAAAPQATLIQCGLDSVRTVALSQWIEGTFGVSISIVELFDAASVGALAALIDERLSAASGEIAAQADAAAVTPAETASGARTPAPASTSASASAPAPAPAPFAVVKAGGAAADAGIGLAAVAADAGDDVSDGQRALLFEQERAPDSAAYHISVAIRLRGTLDAERLDRALAALCRRHPQLASRFVRVDDRVDRREQTDADADAAGVRLQRIDADAWSDAALIAHARAAAQQPFDLSSAVMRGLLYRQRRGDVLLLVVHHIAIDLSSLDILLRDLAACYERDGAAAATPETAAAPYAAFVAWERAFVASPRAEQALAFWRERLAGAAPTPRVWFRPSSNALAPAPASPSMSTMSTIPAMPQAHGFTLDAPRAASIMARARAEGVTPQSVLLAVYAALLWQFTRAPRLVIGASVAGRPQPRFAETVGYFANMLPLPLAVDPRDSLARLARRASDISRRALDHQHYPFSRLVERLAAEAVVAQAPLVRYAFTYGPSIAEDAPLRFAQASQPVAGRFGPLDAVSVPLGRQMAPFDLTLMLLERRDGFDGLFTCDPRMVDPAALPAFAEAFASLLDALLASPATPLARIDAHDAARTAVAGTREVTSSPPAESPSRSQAQTETQPEPRSEAAEGFASVLARFERHAAQTPDRVALTHGDTQVTYRTLDRRAARAAERLRQCGVGPEAIASVACPRGVDLVTAILAVLKAGGAYLPLDTASPAERQQAISLDAGAAAIVTVAAAADRWTGTGLPVVAIDAIDAIGANAAIAADATDAAQNGPASALAASGALDVPAASAASARRAAPAVPASRIAAPEQLAYVIYTSGSTGRPKGVAVTHENVARLLDTTRPRYRFGRDDVWTLSHSIAFDFSVWELWGALTHGARLVIVDQDSAREPARLQALLEQQRVTVLNQTPSAFYNLLASLRAAPADAARLVLRLVVFGGEALDATRLRSWFALACAAPADLVNMYGITETTVHTTWHAIDARAAAEGGGAIGLPLPDVDLQILDAGGHALPAYAPGEIAVGGAGVARGYWRQPSLTAERFVPDAGAGAGVRASADVERGEDEGTRRTGARLYRSGDLGYDAGGARGFHYLGRLDAQVKIRGHRIEPGEIEAHLRRCDGVDWACVLPDDLVDGAAESLTAYVIGTTPPLTVTHLRDRLAGVLPDYMIPARFFQVDAVPTNENGKVDPIRLRASGRPMALGEQYVAPRTDTERAMAAIWADVLQAERVGLDDNYFALGGDSIRSIRIIARARREGLPADLRRLLAGQTIRSLCAEDAPASAAPDSAIDAPESRPFGLLSTDDRARLPRGLEDAFPVVSLLQGLMFHSQFSDDYQIYVTSFHVRGPWRPDAIVDALRAVSTRHAFLRSSLDSVAFSQPMQLVHPAVDVPLTIEDLRPLSPAEQARELHEWIESQKLEPFDWSQAPLWRVALHRRSAETFQITLAEPYLDGWCVARLFHELCAVYLAIVRGEPVPFDEPTQISQRHAALLERRALDDEACGAFWKTYLDGCPDTLIAGVNYKQAPESLLHSRQTILLPESLVARLRDRARAASVPLRSLLLAAHMHMLAQLVDRGDVVCGMIVNGRPEEADGADAIGSFLNVAPFRVRLDPAESWRGYVRRLFGLEQALHPYRRYPFAAMKRLRGTDVRFDSVFNYTHFHALEALRGGAAFDILEAYASEQTFFPLTAHFNQSILSGRLELLLDYNGAAIAAAQVDRLAVGYLACFEAIAAEDDDAAGGVGRTLARTAAVLFPADVALRTPQADADRMATALDAAQIVLEDETVVAMVARRAAETPDAIALAAGDLRLTYRRLQEAATALALHLTQDLGVQPDDVIGLHLGRSPAAIVGILGVLAAGAAYVPLDESCPPERLRMIVEDCGLSVLLTGEGGAAARAAIVASGVRQVTVSDFFRPRTSRAPQTIARQPLRGPAPEMLAYVIYTSGSTGRPKGVGVQHDALANLARAAVADYGMTRGDRLLQFCTLEFDISVEEIFMTLCAGATLVLRPADLLESYDAFYATCAREGITCLNVPTAFWNDWVHEMAGGTRPFDLPLRLVIIAGEQMRPELAAQWLRAVPARVALVNTYGPTEATVKASIYWVGGDGHAPFAPARTESPIGVGFAGATIAVLDARRRPLAPGIYGELLIGGPGVARGYRRRPALTAERFVPDPAAAPPGGRGYRTGDLAVLDADGQAYFVGRLDLQVKIRGFRVELEEVEAALLDCPGVRQAAVIAGRGESGTQALRAFVRLDAPDAADEGLTPDERWARRIGPWIEARLPAYMVPASVRILDRLPVTASGKIDRRALEQMAPADRATATASVGGDVVGGQLRGAAQAQLDLPAESLATASAASVASGASGAGEEDAAAMPSSTADIGVVVTSAADACLRATGIRLDDHFFALGGDSLSAMRFASRLRTQLPCAVSVRDIFEHPRLAHLSLILEERISASAASAAAAGGAGAPAGETVDETPGPRELSLSFAQERLWMAEHLAFDAPIYNIPAAVAIAGAFNVPAFEQSVRELMRRHDVLRTRILLEQNRPTPVCDDDASLAVTHVDLQALDPAARDQALAEIRAEYVERRFDLAAEPPLRLLLVATAPAAWQLVIVIHHIVADAWSIGLLVQELLAFSARAAEGRPSRLPDLPLQYRDHARRQRARLRGAHLARLQEYWIRALAGRPEQVLLPYDRQPPAAPTVRGARHYLHVDAALADALDDLGRREGTTRFMTLLAAYATLLHRHSGQTDLIVGTPVSNRDWPDTEALIGLFVNQLVLRLDLAGTPTRRELLARVRTAVLSAYDHRELPFEDLVDLLQPRRLAGGAAIVQTLFAHRDRPWQQFAIDGVDLQFPDLHNGGAKYSLEVQMIDAGAGGLDGYFEYNVGLFTPAAIERLAEAYRETLRLMVEQPDDRIDAVAAIVAAG